MTSLLEFILNLLRDPVLQEQFKDNPQQALRDHGFDEVCAEDVHDALPLVVDNVQVSGAGGHLPAPQPGEDHLETAVRQIDHIVNNYSYVDSHDTYVDYSVNQTIWTQGDVNQSFDNDTIVASDSTVDVEDNDTVNTVGDNSTQTEIQAFGQGSTTVNVTESDSHDVTKQVTTTDSHEHVVAPYHDVDIDHTEQHGLVNIDDTVRDVDVDLDVLNGLHL